jgi:chromosome segregation ATPase
MNFVGRIDDALNYVHSSESRDASYQWAALDALAAEVRRLREENDRLGPLTDRLLKDRREILDVKSTNGLTCSEWLARTAAAEAEVKRLQKVVADQALTIGTLKDELAMLRDVLSVQDAQHANQRDERRKAERAADAEIERLRKQIEGFEMERDHAQHLLSEERKLTAATAEHTTALERKVAELQEEAVKLRETYSAAHEAHLKIHAENQDLRRSVATMACNHKGIGLVDCRICDPLTKPGATT